MDNNNRFNLLLLNRRNWPLLLLLILIVFPVNGLAQISVSKNTIFIVKENTTIYMAESNFDSLSISRSGENQPKKIVSKKKKKRSKPQQPPMVNKDTELENRNSVLYFTSHNQEPDLFFHSCKKTKATLVNINSFAAKSFPQKKANNNMFSLIFPNNKRGKYSFLIVSNSKQVLLEEHITRPPPFLSESNLEII